MFKVKGDVNEEWVTEASVVWMKAKNLEFR